MQAANSSRFFADWIKYFYRYRNIMENTFRTYNFKVESDHVFHVTFIESEIFDVIELQREH